MGSCVLGNELEIGKHLTTLVDGLLASVDRALVVTLLKLGGAQIRQVGDILVQLPSLFVVRNSDVEVALLVVLGSELLLRVSLFLSLLLCSSFLIFLGLRLRFWLRLGCLGLRWLGGGSCVCHWDIFLGLGLRAGISAWWSAKRHVYTQKNTENLHEARVAHLLSDVIRIGLESLELRHELGIGQEAGRLGVVGELLKEIGVVEHAS